MTQPPIEHITINGRRVAHAVTGTGDPLLLLHGWGANLKLIWPLAEKLAEKGFRCYIPDLPGFGESPPPSEAWHVDDYAKFVLAYMDANDLTQTHLFGHSFGGRISIVLGVEHPGYFDKIILCDSAGVKEETPWFHRLSKQVYRTLAGDGDRDNPLTRALDRVRDAYVEKVGSDDYQNAGPLRETFINVVEQDLLPVAPRLSQPTLLVWGENDTDTPLSHAKKLEAAIPDAGLVVFAGAGHYSYLDALPDAVRVIDYFLKHDE